MKLHLRYREIPEWPPLSWFAMCASACPTIHVFHGNLVETNPEWFCEAVWAGDYDEGNLDTTDLVAGTGGRLRENCLVFVSSGSTVDRLNELQLEDKYFVSNSLSCLLSMTGNTPDINYQYYFEDFRSLIHGLKAYKPNIPTSTNPVRLVYYNNIVWANNKISVIPKPLPIYNFSSFTSYHDFLKNTTRLIAENLKHSSRRFPYKMIGTLSSGYDSPTVTTLIRHLGCNEVICFDRARDGTDDSGHEIARFLGVNTLAVEQSAWSTGILPEIPFIAADCKGEDVFFKGAEQHLKGRVLFTGFHGDKVWSKNTKDLSENIVRGDQSGLSLTEYRLIAGFIHCPIPFWGVRQISEVNMISNSSEMKPWVVPGDYCRPICRRIVEETGCPRELFGIRKKAASVIVYNSKKYLSTQSMSDFMSWLGENKHFLKKNNFMPFEIKCKIDSSIRAIACFAANHNHDILKLPLWIDDKCHSPYYFFRYTFHWAVEHTKKRYPRVYFD